MYIYWKTVARTQRFPSMGSLVGAGLIRQDEAARLGEEDGDGMYSRWSRHSTVQMNGAMPILTSYWFV